MVLFTQFTKATSGLWDAACNEDKRIKYCERCRRIEPQDVADRRDSHMVDVGERGSRNSVIALNANESVTAPSSAKPRIGRIINTLARFLAKMRRLSLRLD